MTNALETLFSCDMMYNAANVFVDIQLTPYLFCREKNDINELLWKRCLKKRTMLME